MPTPTPPTPHPAPTEVAYAACRVEAAQLLEQIAASLETAPSAINWNHVGSMAEVANRLRDLLTFVQGAR